MAIAQGPIHLPGGMIYAYGGRPIKGDPAPAIVFLHGMGRSSDDLYPWFARLEREADLLFLDLPGHGRSMPIERVDLPGLADHVRAAIVAALPGRRVLIVGESLSGLIALQIGATDANLVAGVLAVDPPLVMRKLPHLHRSLRNGAAIVAHPAFFEAVAQSVFGSFGEDREDRIYYDLIGRCPAPVMLLTGDVEVFPIRNLDAATCCLDAVDRYVVETFFGGHASFHRKAGAGHLLLVDHPDWCEARLRELAERAGVPLISSGD